MTSTVFITGASGCVGHYITSQLIHRSDIELHLLLRPSSQLRWNPANHSNVVVHYGNMEDLSSLSSVVPNMDYIIHVFTDWSDGPYATLLNVDRTHDLFAMADPNRLRRILYFSTASILDSNHEPLDAAGKWGPGYIRSKYQSRIRLPNHNFYDRVVTLYPTLVFGGDDHHPYSHISAGLPNYLHYMKYLRYISVSGAFHFLHAHDIATTTIHLMTADISDSHVVLGNPMIHAKDALSILREQSGFRSWFQFPIPTKSLITMADWFGIRIGDWERYCIENPYFTYRAVNPSSFGLPTKYPTLESVIQDKVI